MLKLVMVKFYGMNFQPTLNNLQQILKKADFDFGFRTINEIVRFMYVAWNYDKNVEKPLILD